MSRSSDTERRVAELPCEPCPGSGGGYYSDGAMDRTPTDYWYDCEICHKSHEDRRPRKRKWWYV